MFICIRKIQVCDLRLVSIGASKAANHYLNQGPSESMAPWMILYNNQSPDSI